MFKSYDVELPRGPCNPWLPLGPGIPWSPLMPSEPGNPGGPGFPASPYKNNTKGFHYNVSSLSETLLKSPSFFVSFFTKSIRNRWFAVLQSFLKTDPKNCSFSVKVSDWLLTAYSLIWTYRLNSLNQERKASSNKEISNTICFIRETGVRLVSRWRRDVPMFYPRGLCLL